MNFAEFGTLTEMYNTSYKITGSPESLKYHFHNLYCKNYFHSFRFSSTVHPNKAARKPFGSYV